MQYPGMKISAIIPKIKRAHEKPPSVGERYINVEKKIITNSGVIDRSMKDLEKILRDNMCH